MVVENHQYVYSRKLLNWPLVYCQLGLWTAIFRDQWLQGLWLHLALSVFHLLHCTRSGTLKCTIIVFVYHSNNSDEDTYYVYNPLE